MRLAKGAGVSPGPRAAIGVPLYNGGKHVAEALESLLAQRYANFGVVLVDDCSTDATAEVALRYFERDRRVRFVRNAERLGMIGNWKRAFELSLHLFPGAEYFAWASDHDVWHPRWLEALMAELDASPDCVLAYPQSFKISSEGEVVSKRPWTFDTRGIADPLPRLRLAVEGMSAGNMVYGLFRADVIRRCGVFRPVLNPDRLLISEASVYGQFRQVPEILWYRRTLARVSVERQRAAFFPNGSPLYSQLPWWATHAGALAWSLARRGGAHPLRRPQSAVHISSVYLVRSAAFELGRRRTRRLRRAAENHDARFVPAALRRALTPPRREAVDRILRRFVLKRPATREASPKSRSSSPAPGGQNGATSSPRVPVENRGRL